MKFNITLNDGQELKLIKLSTNNDTFFNKYTIIDEEDFEKRGKTGSRLYFRGKYIQGVIDVSQIKDYKSISKDDEIRISLQDFINSKKLDHTYEELENIMNFIYNNKEELIKILNGDDI